MTMREATGGCHCGKVHFRVRFADPPELLDCNCSICAKTGFLHLIVDKAGFTLERGADALTDYRWGSGTAQHLFCSTCGIKSFYIPRSNPDGYAVTWRCLDDWDKLTVTVVAFDGQNWEANAGRLAHKSID